MGVTYAARRRARACQRAGKRPAAWVTETPDVRGPVGEESSPRDCSRFSMKT